MKNIFVEHFPDALVSQSSFQVSTLISGYLNIPRLLKRALTFVWFSDFHKNFLYKGSRLNALICNVRNFTDNKKSSSKPQ